MDMGSAPGQSYLEKNEGEGDSSREFWGEGKRGLEGLRCLLSTTRTQMDG